MSESKTEEMYASRPLKILTLDGGGLQALATLSSLNAVCRAIAKQHGADRPPAPRELFDIIAGVGTGGFAAGVVPTEDDQSSRYELFRSYHAGESQTDLVLQGPEPADCRMPEVFAATGAAKFFLKPYKIGNTTFFDETFPQSHPISSIAFDEAKRLYGREVEISILLNIGPGIPADKDCQELDLMALDPISRLVGRFTWPSGRRLSLRQRLLSIGMPQPTSKKDSELTSPSEKALRLEDRRREDIKATPEETYGSSGAERYHHLGPAYSAEQASLNDVHALRLPRGDFDGLKQQSIAEAEDMVRKVWVDAVA